jgi:histone H3/H4
LVHYEVGEVKKMYLVTKAQVKEIVGDVNVSEEFYPALNIEVENIIKKAVERMKRNNRRTLMPRDL